MRPRRAPAISTLLVGLAGLIAASGCTLMIDRSDEQCQRSTDCTKYGALCDISKKLCVPMGPPPGTPMAVNQFDARSGDMAEARSGDSAPVEWACGNANKPTVRLMGMVTANLQLNCSSDYLLIGQVVVRQGVVLTIDAGTTVYAEASSRATLIVQPGARLVANGLRTAPIVFTSNRDPGSRAPGDWGGIVLLGKASASVTDPQIMGLGLDGRFGGADDTHDSGALRFVRIEYAGLLPSGTPIAGLVLAGVGSGTAINHVQVRMVSDDCFAFLGGTARAKHLVCQRNRGDGFHWDLGYRGKLQFLVLQQDPTAVGELNGIEVGNGLPGMGRVPVTEPTVYNLSICGRPGDVPGEQYGFLIRRTARAHVVNALVMGFEGGFDIRDAGSVFDIRNSLFVDPAAYPEDGSNTSTRRDDDGGLDELALFNEPSRSNEVGRANIGDCFNPNSFGLAPSPSIRTNAGKPPVDGFFDTQASFIGAFRDAEDSWAEGGWMVWSER